MEIVYKTLGELTPYENNPRNNDEAVQYVKNSIEKFGFKVPIVIDKDGVIVAGHTRYKASMELDLAQVPCIVADDLTEEEIRAFRLADNKTAEAATWDLGMLDEELATIGFDMAQFGFDEDDFGFNESEWFDKRERNDTSRQEGNEEYNEFLDKFEIKKTTDDCFTPDIVFDAVANWVSENYGYKREQMVRPFYPNGDYQKETYPDGCVVVDNPPFSILSEIRRWYTDNGIKYFLFAPSLSCIGGNSAKDCSITANADIIYENGANVPTSFVTNLEKDYVIMTAPDLTKSVQDAAREYAKQLKKSLPKYSYPSHVITAAIAGYLSKYGQDLKIKRNDAFLIRELDAQKEQGKAIYGGGYLLSEKAAAEKAAAEKAAATVWELSEREKEIVRSLG